MSSHRSDGGLFVEFCCKVCDFQYKKQVKFVGYGDSVDFSDIILSAKCTKCNSNISYENVIQVGFSKCIFSITTVDEDCLKETTDDETVGNDVKWILWNKYRSEDFIKVEISCKEYHPAVEEFPTIPEGFTPKTKKTSQSKLFMFLEKHGFQNYYKNMKNDVKYEDLGIFLEDTEALVDYIPKKFNRIKFLKALKIEMEKEKRRRRGTDMISGEYIWNGKSLQIKGNFAYFNNQRYEFENLTSFVYKIRLGGLFIFMWDEEDEMLRVVRTEGEYEFIKRVKSTHSSSNIIDLVEDPISGEYDWNGKILDFKKNFCYFERKRFGFEKVASTVYTVEMNDKKRFVFNWDKEDKVLGVVEAEGEGFFEKIDEKVFSQKIEE